VGCNGAALDASRVGSRKGYVLLAGMLILLAAAEFAAAGAVPLHHEFAPGPDGAGVASIRLRGKPIRTPAAFDSLAGTISFWVRPDWSAARKSRSHTLFSARWSGNDGSYLVISDGWWEPAGSEFMYFVLSNEDLIHCRADHRLPKGEWTLITASWSSGRCTLYVDTTPHISHHEPPPERRARQLVLGADNATPLAAGRVGEGDYANLRFFDRPLDQREVEELFEIDGLSELEHAGAAWRWLAQELRDPLGDERRRATRRIIFDEGHHWAVSREETQRRLDRIAQAGFNVYVPTIYYGRGTYYSSELSHSDPNLREQLQDDDPLEQLTVEAHRRGIEIHGHVTVVKRQDAEYPQYYDDGTPRGAFDVHNSQFREFIASIIAEAVERYELDGINLDYIRAMGICRSASCAASYHAVSGRNLHLDRVLRYIQESAAENIARWQESAVTDLVIRVRAKLSEIGRPVALSVCFNSIVDTPFSLQGRAARAWLNAGLIDAAYDMQYARYLDVPAIDAFRASLQDPTGHIVLHANYNRDDAGQNTPRRGKRLRQLERFTVNRWPEMAFGVYLYHLLTNEQIQAIAPPGRAGAS